MPLVEINRNPTPRQLRQFAAAGFVLLPFAAWLWGASAAAVALFAAAGAAAVAASWVAPRAIRPIFIALAIATAPLGVVVGEAALLTLYFGVFLPIGLARRVLRRDPLEARLEPEAPSYWRQRKAVRDAASYYRQS